MGRKLTITALLLSFLLTAANGVWGTDLAEIQKAGELRHLGVPYANFVTGSGDGFSVELVQGFARHLNVRYRFVETKWSRIIQELSGNEIRLENNAVQIVGETPVRGDIAATGLTILPWRRKVIDYSQPTFPTQIWLLAKADSVLQPIKPSGDTNRDVDRALSLLKGVGVLGISGTCLDPSLYVPQESGARAILFTGPLNQLAPAVIKGEAETCLYEVPDALSAIQKWPGKLKVIGPVSENQTMACGFNKQSPELRSAFNRYLAQIKKNGTYRQLIEKYYADVLLYFPDFL